MTNSPSVLRAIFVASRPKTWIAGISPVLIGVALAMQQVPIRLDLFLCSLFFSLFIQIGTNFSNDYYDFQKGADTKKRIGPARAVAQGWIAPETMLRSSLALFAAATFVSIPLVLICGLWSFAFVASSIAFGILYTGGPRPLGYMGLGEPLVLLYFGPVAVLGTYFVQVGSVSSEALCISLAPGFLSTAILVANNLRDETTDRDARKNTLVVRWGRNFGRMEYIGSILVSAMIPLYFGYYLPLLVLSASVPMIRKVITYRTPSEVVSLLPQTALLLIVFTLAFCLESLS